jgi:hypothetical protein
MDFPLGFLGFTIATRFFRLIFLFHLCCLCVILFNTLFYPFILSTLAFVTQTLVENYYFAIGPYD